MKPPTPGGRFFLIPKPNKKKRGINGKTQNPLLMEKKIIGGKISFNLKIFFPW